MRERAMLKSDLINVLVAKKGMTQKQAEATPAVAPSVAGTGNP